MCWKQALISNAQTSEHVDEREQTREALARPEHCNRDVGRMVVDLCGCEEALSMGVHRQEMTSDQKRNSRQRDRHT